MQVGLSLKSPQLGGEDLQSLTRDFCAATNEDAALEARLAQHAAGPGTRSAEAFTLGSLAITFLTSGAAVALINVCKSFFERNSSLEINLERGDGKKFGIKAQNVKPEQIGSTLETLSRFLESG